MWQIYIKFIFIVTSIFYRFNNWELHAVLNGGKYLYCDSTIFSFFWELRNRDIFLSLSDDKS